MSAPAVPEPRPPAEALVAVPAPRRPVGRGTSNGNARGNVQDRARRRAWLLATFGDGQTCPCHRCGLTLDDSTITVDRIVPGIEGGTYRRSNIRPACGPCNSEAGARLAHERTHHRLTTGLAP
ncbi:HNH endonuclease [Pseudonocardia sp. McavD-2-B]|uniref:HNH endonuclease n=1 Tax=Pseudonocardia sp. McavD-2-B TaxID=2954499 RepID=UPI0020977766|nr:HNH endonuclease [Pseudonocardia sp. McavD-2-B]MCO7195044.1 HNH endonuclease [Pseudonocardia sp. McavD-2-B]